jgi:DNA-binding IclR family transcriptional regulator
MPALRRNVLTMMLDNQDTLDWKTKELAEDLGYPTNTTRRVLEDLNCYDIVLRMEDGNADIWRLSDWTKNTYQLAKIVPEILEGDI